MVVMHHLAYSFLWERIGWAGVDLFFVLSGYLIAGLLFTEWQQEGTINFPRFFVRRAFKIYPGFYLLLLVTIIADRFYQGIASFPVTIRSIISESLYVQNYFTGIWGQTWSLAVEEHFYILLPLMLWAFCRLNRGGEPFRSIPAMFIIVATLELLLRVRNTWHMTYVIFEPKYLMPTHLRIDGLLFGVTLSYYKHFKNEEFRQMAKGAAPYVVMASALFLLLLVPLNNPIMHTIGFTMNTLGFGFMLVKCANSEPTPTVQRLIRPLSFVGFYSYSIYLWHGWICRLLPHETFPSFIGCIFAAVALGVGMGKLVEMPMLKLRDAWVPKTHLQKRELSAT